MTGSRGGSLVLSLAVGLGFPADAVTQEDARGREPDFPVAARIRSLPALRGHRFQRRRRPVRCRQRGANGFGQIWRVDPVSGESVLIAEDMPGAASIAFGAGAFNPQSIYVTSTRTGKVWEVYVGARGAVLHH
jgi:hypothetical protein